MLVVDGEPTMRMLVTKVLDVLGCRAIETADAAASPALPVSRASCWTWLRILDRAALDDYTSPVQAANPNRPATKATCAFMFQLPALRTCPFLTIAVAS